MKASETYWGFSGSMSVVDQSHKALDYVNQAIEIDPAFALTHSWVAFIYWSLGSLGGMGEKEAYLKAKEAVLKALELDANLAHARKRS